MVWLSQKWEPKLTLNLTVTANIVSETAVGPFFPAPFGGTVFVGAGANIYAFDAAHGELRWEVMDSNLGTATAAFEGTGAYIGVELAKDLASAAASSVSATSAPLAMSASAFSNSSAATR